MGHRRGGGGREVGADGAGGADGEPGVILALCATWRAVLDGCTYRAPASGP
jgi:hypothetical protein